MTRNSKRKERKRKETIRPIMKTKKMTISRRVRNSCRLLKDINNNRKKRKINKWRVTLYKRYIDLSTMRNACWQCRLRIHSFSTVWFHLANLRESGHAYRCRNSSFQIMRKSCICEILQQTTLTSRLPAVVESLVRPIRFLREYRFFSICFFGLWRRMQD